MTLAFSTRTVIAEERFDPVGEFGRLFPVDVDDQGRAVSVAVVDDKREFVETIRVSVCLKLFGDALGEITKGSVRGGGVEPFTLERIDPGMVLQLSTTVAGAHHSHSHSLRRN